jgi:hypothetical protein
MNYKIFLSKKLLRRHFFRISGCAKNVVEYTVNKCHNRISKVEKSQHRLDSVIMRLLTLYYHNILISCYIISNC